MSQHLNIKARHLNKLVDTARNRSCEVSLYSHWHLAEQNKFQGNKEIHPFTYRKSRTMMQSDIW